MASSQQQESMAPKRESLNPELDEYVDRVIAHERAFEMFAECRCLLGQGIVGSGLPGQAHNHIRHPASAPSACRSKIEDFTYWTSKLLSESKLTGRKDYVTWALLVSGIAKHTGYLGYLDGTVPISPDSDLDAISRYVNESRTISSTLLSLVDPASVLPHLNSTAKSSPRAIWTELERRYQLTPCELFVQLVDMRFSESEELDFWVARVRNVYLLLKETDAELKESAVCSLMINSFPPSFESLVTRLRATPSKEWTIAGFSEQLQNYYWDYPDPMDMVPNSAGSLTNGESVSKPPTLEFDQTGHADPLFAAKMANACRACYSNSHQLGSKECAHYGLWVAAGWISGSSGQDKKKKKKKSKKSKAAVDEQIGGSPRGTFDSSGETFWSSLPDGICFSTGVAIVGNYDGAY